MSLNFVVNLDVDDLDRATRFYGSAFGLKVGRQFGDFGVEMLGGPAPIYLLLKAAGSQASASSPDRRDYGRHWTPVHLDFVVEDIEACVQQAIAAGARLEAPTSSLKWGQLALMSDPFGHGFCFIQFAGRGYDEIVA